MLFRRYLFLLLLAFLELSFAQSTQLWQRLEFHCANTISLTHVSATPEQITLIFNDAFYPMKQLGKTQDATRSVRYENETLIWVTENSVGRLEQKDGKILAKDCVAQAVSETPPVLRYLCKDDVSVNVHYVNDVAHISVTDPTYGDQSYELPKVVSASGAKFSNGMTTWFVKGESANLFEETEEVQHAEECKVQKD
jgi:membrane-bound inhibitor of C-type lysozyme